MVDIKTRYDDLIAVLKGSDFRLTPQGVELMQLIASSDGHPSATQL